MIAFDRNAEFLSLVRRRAQLPHAVRGMHATYSINIPRSWDVDTGPSGAIGQCNHAYSQIGITGE
ncbi:MAG TPA: hypothetical protein VF086_04215 [Propionibacteriaceae bacterium]